VRLQVRAHDLAARINVFETAHGKVETPTVLPVINPNKILIPPSQMNVDAVITNAYILWKQHYDDVTARGVHDFLSFNKTIMTDSGAYQLMEYGDIDVSNEEIIAFQQAIAVDIGTVLDIPTASKDYATIKQNVHKTLERLREGAKLFRKNILRVAPIQGSVFPRLVKESSTKASSLDYDIHALGSMVPLLKDYHYDKVIDAIAAARANMPSDRLLHLFGAGHPVFFSFAAAIGVDLFDSASYALYARDNRYITEMGTSNLKEMKHLPCSCSVCRGNTVSDILNHPQKEKLLAEHNLNVILEEIERIKEAINEGTLWELLEVRARAHPSLLKAFKRVLKYTKLLESQDPIVKKHIFILSPYSRKQPAVKRAIRRIKKVKGKKMDFPPYGKVPIKVLDCFPFNQTVSEHEIKLKKSDDDYEKLKAISEYWFGCNVFSKNVKIRRSKLTKRMRSVHKGDKTLASFDASSYLLYLHEAALTLHDKTKRKKAFRVVVDNSVREFASSGRNVFAKFVKACDPEIVPGQVVLVVDEEDNLLCSGEAKMSAKEMLDFNFGVAVKPRWHP